MCSKLLRVTVHIYSVLFLRINLIILRIGNSQIRDQRMNIMMHALINQNIYASKGSFSIRICNNIFCITYIMHNILNTTALNIITSIAHWIKTILRRTSKHNDKYNYLNFSFFHKIISVFYYLKTYFLLKTDCSLIDFNVIFPRKSS